MAGIEQLEIHSKSYIVRWVKLDEGHTISWSLQPHKKSINFGIVKHPGTGGTNLATSQLADDVSTDQLDEHGGDAKAGLFGRRSADTAEAQLAKKGFIIVQWHGKCEADKVTIGTFDCPPGQGGMFGLVFDNTFSKQTSKNATFVLLTYPTGSPPQTAHHLPSLQAGAAASRANLGKHAHNSPRLGAAPSESVDSLHSGGQKTASIAGKSEAGSTLSNYHVGTLLKRRRKKGQGYARRYFSLDYTTCTLSYFHNRSSSALRGAIPLSLAAIAADERRREISIDSGAEVWHLKASNDKEFADWAKALERASRIARGFEAPPEPAPERLHVRRSLLAPPNTQQEAEKEWQQVEALVGRLSGTRDALRRLVKDLAAERRRSSAHLPPAAAPSAAEEPDYMTAGAERKPFWRRKSNAAALTPQALSPAVSSSLAVPAPGSVAAAAASGPGSDRRTSRVPGAEESGVSENYAALLSDLDSVVAEFSNLLSNSKRRRLPAPASAGPRKSFDSTTSTEEFFDAEAGEADRPQILRIDHQSEEEAPASDASDATVNDSSSVSSVEDEDDFHPAGAGHSLYPAKPKSLSPLPITAVIKRRTTIPPAKVPPPSLIAFVRKNVGKDLSTITMPVTANEPISLLQRTAETLEYAQLLDAAAKQERPHERLLYVAAFAASQFSSARAKERSNRKPFNPLLGETYELLMSETEVPGGMRLLVEKVSHRPVRLAIHADGQHWSFAQSPAPAQKFWGKSAEITTEGRARICLRLPDGAAEEHYSFNVATVFLRNVVMGEKYAEPVGTMQVFNDSTGAKATVEFRSKGMFGGRGEDVQVETYGPDGSHWGASMAGTWTGSLRTPAGEVWRAGRLADNAAATYGLTAFAAALNEITALEAGRLPPTDTRLRPDQRLAEEGDLDAAEAWKARLEEAQRRRRRQLEERGEEHRPRWFARAATAEEDGEEVWRIKGGRDGYWEARERGQWGGIEDIFAA